MAIPKMWGRLDRAGCTGAPTRKHSVNGVLQAFGGEFPPKRRNEIDLIEVRPRLLYFANRWQELDDGVRG
jgi:hypothetical protein